MKKLIKCLRRDCLRKDKNVVYSLFKTYNIKMKTIRKLNAKDWSGYFFTEMINIIYIDHEDFLINDFKDCKDGSVLFNIAYCEEGSVPHIVFNNIECIFKKSGIYSYLIFCESKRNKEMLDNYTRIVDKIKEEILSFGDDEILPFVDFMRFRFKADDYLVYNKKIDIPIIELCC